ncbi:MAG TPA: tRNA 2-thiouridine(34) synthase MnmA [Sumerlaeia bacterium]|nr:tRNA 2-thiouridine(34) synthase MnmA [Sumerlaeia bacterium]
MGAASAKSRCSLFPPSFEPWRAEEPDRAVAVLMSGGVDSSVAALLLKQAGWDAVGITMKIPMVETYSRPRLCCGVEAALVCRALDLPHYVVDVAEVFRASVIEPFRRAYAEGCTPSPCVDCNTFVKFQAVWDILERELGVRRVATGHYARVIQEGARTVLARGRDVERDQSYFIYGVPRERLERLLLPLGDWEKERVRATAREQHLEVAERADSMEICFAGEGDYRNALGEAARPSPGPIVDVDGNVLGRHRGIGHYTVGQRRGLGIAAPQPLYVLRVDAGRNTLVVGTRRQAYGSLVRARRLNALLPDALDVGVRLFGKIRSIGEPAPCTVVDARADELAVRFEPPVFAPAPGQHLVLYDLNGRVVGGGAIRTDSLSEREEEDDGPNEPLVARLADARIGGNGESPGRA